MEEGETTEQAAKRELMEEAGMADDFLKGIDWDTFDLRTTTQEVVNRLSEPTGRFFMTHTKAELLEGAVKRGVRLRNQLRLSGEGRDDAATGAGAICGLCRRGL